MVYTDLRTNYWSIDRLFRQQFIIVMVMDKYDKNILYCILVQKEYFKNVNNILNIIENFVWETI